MDFDKPIVTPKDIAVIMILYPFGAVVECEKLGGIPNTTYKVVTEDRVVAVRVYSHGQSSTEHIQLEVEVLQHLVALGFSAPRLLRGTNGQILQLWKGYWVCATDFIPGTTADRIKISPSLVGDVGRLVAFFQKAMVSFKLDRIPEGETLIEKGVDALRSLHSALEMRGWEMDVRRVRDQWEQASSSFVKHSANLNCNVIHADIWPPNVICTADKVAAVVDFDDCCYGQTMLDVVVALMEFSMFQSAVVDAELAKAFLTGYFRYGGNLSPLEQSLIVNAMEMTCAMWLAYNVIQAPTFEEADVYLQRLNLLHNDNLRNRLQNDIDQFINTARLAV